MNSSLASYTKLSPHYQKLSNKKIKRISIHAYVGQVTAKQGVDYFYNVTSKKSANYVVGRDGSIGVSVDEGNRAYTTSSADNDSQAITIEVACEKTAPYKVTDAAFSALVDLVVDICKRNNIEKMIWVPDKEKALSCNLKESEGLFTVHCWFANKSCPGPYLLSKHEEIAETVNKRLKEEEEVTQEQFNAMMETYLAELAAKPVTWEKTAMDWAQGKGLIKGDENGATRPKSYITRGEFAEVLRRFANGQ